MNEIAKLSETKFLTFTLFAISLLIPGFVILEKAGLNVSDFTSLELFLNLVKYSLPLVMTGMLYTTRIVTNSEMSDDQLAQALLLTSSLITLPLLYIALFTYNTVPFFHKWNFSYFVYGFNLITFLATVVITKKIESNK